MRASLSSLLQAIGIASTAEAEVLALSLSSGDCQAGTLFCAVAGTRQHGLNYAAQAVERGAVAVVYDPLGAPVVTLPKAVPLIPVSKLGQRLGELGAAFHGRPAEALTLVGVTGTDGKSSVVNFTGQLLRACGIPAATLGTLGLDLGQGHVAGSHTTPDALTLQAQLAHARAAGCQAFVMEVSSHAIAQGRVAGVAFDHVALTTLGRDHLDYHRSLSEYHATKRRLLAWPGVRTAHINGDAPLVRRAWEQAESSAALHVYGGASDARWHLQDAVPTAAGLDVQICVGDRQGHFALPLYGGFNAGNALAAASLAEACGAPVEGLLEQLPQLRTVPGRMQALRAPGAPTAIIDYAHTAEALDSALQALRAHRPTQLACVFGCGGDRDRGKRPLMAAAAEKLADRLYLTDDNPRTEPAEQIFADIRAGLRKPRSCQALHDREAAIRLALDESSAEDIVLIAGKGHEDYQLVGSERRSFSDHAVVRAWMQERQA